MASAELRDAASPSRSADAAGTAEAGAGDDSALVDLAAVQPDILLDMRYASTRNFVGKVVYPSARCLLRRPVAQALARVQKKLRAQGMQLLVWDCYRPFAVQEAFWQLVPDSRYVARPVRQDGRPVKGSKHNRGAAIDLTLADKSGTPLLMPTDHDDFSERAHRGARDVPEEARQNAALLERAMSAEDFVGIATEWWHFDHEGWRQYPLE